MEAEDGDDGSVEDKIAAVHVVHVLNLEGRCSRQRFGGVSHNSHIYHVPIDSEGRDAVVAHRAVVHRERASLFNDKVPTGRVKVDVFCELKHGFCFCRIVQRFVHIAIVRGRVAARNRVFSVVLEPLLDETLDWVQVSPK
jgi:hypothetical protein